MKQSYDELTPDQQATIDKIKAATWPEVFETGKIPEVYTEMAKRGVPEQAKFFLAKDVLMGEAKIGVGCRPPENYYTGLTELVKLFRMNITRESMHEFIDNWKP